LAQQPKKEGIVICLVRILKAVKAGVKVEGGGEKKTHSLISGGEKETLGALPRKLSIVMGGDGGAEKNSRLPLKKNGGKLGTKGKEGELIIFIKIWGAGRIRACDFNEQAPWGESSPLMPSGGRSAADTQFRKKNDPRKSELFRRKKKTA